ncbi:30S ribosomal protein S10 [Candidatus Peregrinibacteria bacterium CG10_big_fil_rev_8_21_14_0_10_49_10]|nr:MAG: 30S ribosomal protein S10 [Candidatus Peregrinibacteria bacterium CG10_big_fil_rev_8_21_14_0_10_49_10]
MIPEKKKPAAKKTPVKKSAQKESSGSADAKSSKKKGAAQAKVQEKEEDAKESKETSGAKKKDQKAPSTIRIRLSAFDHIVLDEAVNKIIDTAERSGAVVHGPIPLPTKIRKFTVNRSTFVHKDARDQFEMRTHRRLIDLKETTFKTIESLQSLSLPSGVDIEIKMS